MSHSTAYLAHHFDDIHQQREAMTLGMWVFLVTEVMFFGGLFATYTIYRWRFPLGFLEGSSHLDFIAGTINTAVLLVSSFTVVLAVHAAQTDHRRRLVVYLASTIVLGSVFLGIKGYEYYHKFQERHVPGPRFELAHPTYPDVDPRHVEMFYVIYFAVTGLHATHMVIGIGIFLVLLLLAKRGRFSSAHYMPVELAGLYWHFVDIVWVFLYPMLYLIS